MHVLVARNRGVDLFEEPQQSAPVWPLRRSVRTSLAATVIAANRSIVPRRL
jgi:hypothetical protein